MPTEIDWTNNSLQIEKISADNEQNHRNWQRKILTVSWITYASFYLCKANIGAALPQIRKSLNVSKLAVSAIPAGFKLIYGIGQFVNGQLGDHVNPRYLITLGMIGTLVVNFIFGFGDVVSVLSFLVILWGINGFFQSMGWPPLVKILANWFSSSSRGKAMGIISTSYQIGASVALIFAGSLVSHFGWRYAFWTPALLVLLLAIFFFKSIKISPQSRRYTSSGLAEISSYPEKSQDSQKSKGLSYTIKYTLTNPMAWLIALSCSAINIVRYVYIDWGPSYIMGTQDVSVAQATYQVSAVQIGGVVGSIVVGRLADSSFGDRRSPIIFGTLAFLGFFVFIHSYVNQISIVLGIICLFMVGFTTYGPFAILTGAEVQDLGGKHAVSSVSGFIGALSYLGAFLGDIATGWFTKNYGWQGGIIFWSSMAFFATALIIPMLLQTERFD